MSSIQLYASCHVYMLDSIYVLKGGTATQPSSISGIGGILGGAAALSDGVCSDYGGKLDDITSSLGDIGNGMNSPMKGLRSELDGLIGGVASPINDIDNGLDIVSSDIAGSVPSVPDVSEIEKLMQECSILNGDLLSGGLSPGALIGDFLDQAISFLLDNLNNALDGLSSLLEFPAGLLINQINDLLDKFNIGGLLSEFDSYINCLEAICGRDFDLPSVPNMDSNGFPPVQGFDSMYHVAGYPDIGDMIETPDFSNSMDKIKNLTGNRLPDIESFGILDVPGYAQTTDIPGYPYITDMVKDAKFNESYKVMKDTVVTNEFNDDLLKTISDPEYPEIKGIPGYPDVAEMIHEPAFNSSRNDAQQLAQAKQVPYLEYVDEAMSYVNNMLNDLNLTDEGKFDPTKAIADVDLPTDIIDNLNTINETVEIDKQAAVDAIELVASSTEAVLNTTIEAKTARIKEAVDYYS